MKLVDLNLPGSLQGQQYEYDRHINGPIEEMVKTVYKTFPLFALICETGELIEIIQSRVVER
jgi:hypothetical protein